MDQCDEKNISAGGNFLSGDCHNVEIMLVLEIVQLVENNLYHFILSCLLVSDPGSTCATWVQNIIGIFRLQVQISVCRQSTTKIASKKNYCAQYLLEMLQGKSSRSLTITPSTVITTVQQTTKNIEAC